MSGSAVGVIAMKIPVTVLTGYLGAGKTTLLRRMLTAPGGRRYAVIVNEFAELGIDSELIENRDEQVIQLSNGCLCCSVRGDLLHSLENPAREGWVRCPRHRDNRIGQPSTNSSNLHAR